MKLTRKNKELKNTSLKYEGGFDRLYSSMSIERLKLQLLWDQNIMLSNILKSVEHINYQLDEQWKLLNNK